MKKFLLSALVLALQSFIFNQVSAEYAIMTVDVSTLYDNYYKTKEAGEKIQGRFDTAKAQLDEMIASGEVEVEAYKTIRVPGVSASPYRHLWILFHSDLRRTVRVRRFVDFLTVELMALRQRMQGELYRKI